MLYDRGVVLVKFLITKNILILIIQKITATNNKHFRHEDKILPTTV